MFKVIQAVRKPCLAYKILAAGRRVDSPAQVQQSFETAFANLKRTDALIVGMWQQHSDQVTENAAFVRKLGVAKQVRTG
jgi:copper oxidase (laccase) domain-containing protein